MTKKPKRPSGPKAPDKKPKRPYNPADKFDMPVPTWPIRVIRPDGTVLIIPPDPLPPDPEDLEATE